MLKRLALSVLCFALLPPLVLWAGSPPPDPTFRAGLPIGLASPFPAPPTRVTLSNGFSVDSSGNLYINAAMGGGGTYLTNGLAIDSSGNLLVNCAVGCGGGTYTADLPIVVTGTVIGCPTCGTSSATVESVSVTTANGVSGTVATPTTTPAITLTLGAITPSTVNGLTFSALTAGFSIAGGTTSKTLTVSNAMTLAGTDSSTLNIGTGGTLASGAFAAAYVLPTATSSTLGGVKPDNSTILNAAGVLSATPASIGLGNVTNDAQTKAAVMPNTAPGSAYLPIGTGSAYVPRAITGDATLSSLGVWANTGFDTVPICTGFTPTNGQFLEYTTGSSPNPCYTAATASGSFTAGGDLSGTSSNQTVKGLDTVPFCTGFTPANAQFVEYTTASSPNPCYTAAVPSGVLPSGTTGNPLVNTTGSTSYATSSAVTYAENFCPSNSFNGSTCTTGDMGAAVNAAIASVLAAGHSCNIDARAFNGNQVLKQTNAYGNTSVMFYGGQAPGTNVICSVFLGGYVNIAIDGPSAGFFTDGIGSSYGTPALILPGQFKLHMAKSTGIHVCTGVNAPYTGCTTAFPQRSLPLTGIAVTCSQGCQGVYTTSTTLTFSGGPTNVPPQNIYPYVAGGPGLGGEFVYVSGTGTTAYNVARTVRSATSSTFTIPLPAGTSTAGCSSSCGTAYLGTPIFGWGAGITSAPYGAIQAGWLATGVSQQTFNNGIEGGTIFLGTITSAYPGLEAMTNVNGGELSFVKDVQVFYMGNAGGLIVRSGSNDSGPYEDLYITNTTSNVGTKATVPIASEGSNRGIVRWSVIMSNTSNPVDAAVMLDTTQANVPYNCYIGRGHSEWPTDYIEVGANAPTSGCLIEGHWMQNTGHGSVNGIHFMRDGLTANVIKNVTVMHVNAQSGALSGATLQDDNNSVSCTDLAITQYSLDVNGYPAINTCGGGLASPILSGTVNVSGLTASLPICTDASKNLSSVCTGLVTVADMNATGAPSSSTYLRGDGTWSAPSGGGGANTALSNLASPAVNLALSPGTDNSISLDDLSHRYINAWLSGVLGWTNGSGTADTGLSRDSAGVVDVGNGTAGDSSGTVKATVFQGSGTNGGMSGTEGTGANGCTPASGTDCFYPDSTLHDWHGNLNNTDVGGAVFTGKANTFTANQTLTGHVIMSGHDVAIPLVAADSSGSGTAQSATTSPSYTPAANDCVTYTTTTTNSGTGLTTNINSLGAKSIAIAGSSGWTTTLTASIIPANKPQLLCYDGTNWDDMQTGTAASGGGGIAPVYDTATSGQTGNLAAVTMVTPGANHDYLFNWTVELSVAGTSCTGNTTVTLNAIFQSINGSGTTTQALGTLTIAAGGVGAVGFVAEGSDNILAKSGTAVQFSTSGYTLGTSCTSTNPTYIVYPTLVQLW